MPDPSPNLGRIAEDWIERICTSTFLADFTIRNPTYQKRGGKTKEAADLLVVFGDTLLIFQIKTKVVSDAESALEQIDLERTSHAVGKAFDQLHAMIEASTDPSFFTFTNARGHTVKVEKDAISRFHALVIYGLLAPDGQFSKTKLRFRQTCFPDDVASVHLFEMNEFRVLATLADTFRDFMLFLDTRTVLHEKNLIDRQTLPMDVWALMTFESTRLLEAMKANARLEIANMHERHIEKMQEWEDSEKPSYFVDWLIEKLYEGIESGVNVRPDVIEKVRLLARPSSLDAYQQTIPKLAMLRRRDRNQLAIAFAQVIERAKSDGMAFRVLKFEHHEEAFFVLAINFPRPDRQVALFNLARAAAYKIGVRHVVGIASAPLELASTDYDTVLVDAKDMVIDQALIDAVAYHFGEPQIVSLAPTTPSMPES